MAMMKRGRGIRLADGCFGFTEHYRYGRPGAPGGAQMYLGDGERQYGARDLDGHHWLFATHARDVSPAEWGATITTQLAP